MAESLPGGRRRRNRPAGPPARVTAVSTPPTTWTT